MNLKDTIKVLSEETKYNFFWGKNPEQDAKDYIEDLRKKPNERPRYGYVRKSEDAGQDLAKFREAVKIVNPSDKEALAKKAQLIWGEPVNEATKPENEKKGKPHKEHGVVRNQCWNCDNYWDWDKAKRLKKEKGQKQYVVCNHCGKYNHE